MITISHSGDFKNIESFFVKSSKASVVPILETYGRKGVDALANATPKDTGLTASSWDYKIEKTGMGYSIGWFNTNVNNGVVIAILLQYGHGTGNGGYVQGRDYINPAIRPIFDAMSEEIWKEVSSL